MSTETQNNTPVSAESVAHAGLLPCPFCGGSAHLSRACDLVNVRCDGWNPGECLGAGPNCYTEAEAVASWNRRAAPVAAQPDITQQTLDDVKAGIPARDAEIDSLRKEIETLRDANKADAGQNYNDGFSDGVILALQLMSMHGDYGGTQYCELLSAAGPNQIVERAISEGMWEMSGLSQTPTAVERRAAIDAARKEQA